MVELITPAITEPVVAPVTVAPDPTPLVTATVEVPSPVVETVVTAPVETPIVEAVTPAPEPVKDTGAVTLLAEPQPTPTPEPTPVVVQETNTDGGQSAEPAPPPTYEPFKIPESTPLDSGRISEFTNLLSELETSGKADHGAVQAFGQKAVDFHLNEINKALETHSKYMVEAFENQKTSWRDDFLKDPELGGNRHQTTLSAARDFIRTHGGTAEQQAEILSLMDSSGLGNHKALIRLFANAGGAMSEGKPLATVKPVPQVKSRTQTMYGQS